MKRKSKIAVVLCLLLSAAGGLASYAGLARRNHAHAAATRPEPEPAAGIEFVGAGGRFRVSDETLRALDIHTIEVKPAPPPEPLKLTGSLLLDPNRLVRIHARFAGELVSLGTVPVDQRQAGDAVGERRPIRYGDKVVKNQLLAVVASKDVGEKKSELVDAISKRDIDHTLLTQYELVPQVIPGRTIHEARRNYQGDEIAVARAERTLRSWRLTEENVQNIHEEAKRVQHRETSDPTADSSWAEIEMRSPISGLVVEKNFNVGDIVDITQDLFKIADLSRILVVANAYEEDLPLLRAMPAAARTWRIDVKADPNDVPIAGKFDIVGNIIDPLQHAGTVMGAVDNPDGRLSVGEFVTVTIDLPADPSLVAVPTAAVVEEGGAAKVFVETDARRHEFACRPVVVANRGRERSYIRRLPVPAQCAHGETALKPGERVVGNGAVALAAAVRRERALAGDPKALP